MRSVIFLSVIILSSCTTNTVTRDDANNIKTGLIQTATQNDTLLEVEKEHLINIDENINTGNITPAQLLAFAQSLQGIPYKYGSINPAEGFDCSGFITYVFNHFNITVPRSSVGFTNVGTTIALEHALPGDIILFTGTDSSIRTVGHMGIITDNFKEKIHFIHSTSGKADGVTTTPLNNYYMGRFVKVIRIFAANNQSNARGNIAGK